jgi:tryptophanyl-tRNA synthetase
METKKRVVSGMRPTGKLHLGNYFGALKNWIELQDRYECFFFVADWHSFTTSHDKSDIKQLTHDMVVDWLAAGLDPKKCVFFRQSALSQHAEMSLLLGMITPLNWLLANPTYKEQLVELYERRYAGQEKGKKPEAGKLATAFAKSANIDDQVEVAAMSELSTFGFLGYPVLMATDILVHKGNYVPVGKDQLAHLELSRDIARRFGEIYGKDILTLPEPLLTKNPKVLGIDGRKMSKSYGNAIDLDEPIPSLEKKVRSMFTDPKKIRANDKGNPEGCVVFSFHQIYNPNVSDVEKQCKSGELGCVQCKKNVFESIKKHVEEFTAKKAEVLKNPSIVEEILEKGNKVAFENAENITDTMRRAMKII